MKSIRVLAGFVPGLILGAVAGFAFARTAEPPTSSGGEAAPTAATGRSHAADALSDHRPSGRPWATSPTPGSSPHSSPHTDPLEAALRAVDLLPLPAGDRVITGNVVDPDGAPIAGVAIQLMPRDIQRPNVLVYGALGDPSETWSKLMIDVRNIVQVWQSYRPESLRQVTGADGMFRFIGLGDSAYSVVGYMPGLALPEAQETNPGGHVTLVGEWLTDLRVRFNAPQGIDPRNCYVMIADLTRHLQWGGADPAPAQDATRTLHLRPGLYTLTAGCDAPPATGETAAVTIERGKQPADITLALAAHSSMSGSVRMEGGRLLGFLGAIWAPVAPTGNAEQTLKEALNTGQAHSRDVDDGKFQFNDMRAGRIAVGIIVGDDLAPADCKVIEHSGGVSAVEFVIRAPEASACITCTVRDARGRPLDLLNFKISSADSGELYPVAWRIAPGEYRLAVRPETPPAPAAPQAEYGPAAPRPRNEPVYTITGYGNGNDVPTAQVHNLLPQQVELVLSRTAAVAVQVESSDSLVDSGLELRIVNPAGEEVAEGNHSSNGSLSALKSFVPLGSQRLEVRLRPGFGTGTITVHSEDIVVPEQGLFLRVKLPKLSTLTLTGPEDNTINGTLKGRVGAYEFSFQVSVRGQLKLQHLPAGNYMVTWRPPDTDWLDDPKEVEFAFTLPGTETVNLRR